MAEKRPSLDFDSEVANFIKNDRQMKAVQAIDSNVIKFLLYGGALGGGKSYFLRWIAVRLLVIRYFLQLRLKWVTVMLACEDYPSLADRQLQKIAREFPPWLGKSYDKQKVYGRCFILEPEYGNGVICFRNLDDPSKYQSAEFAAILVDELTKNDYDTFTFLRSRLRWPGVPDILCPFIGGTNPGGKGHGWTKQFWMSKVFPEEFIKPIDYRSQFAYIPSKASDNPYIDQSYWAMLNTLPVHLRKAFRDGNWDVFVGQAFQEWTPPVHVIKPFPIPEGAPLYFTFDWGFGAPFSCGWWFVDADGRVIRFAEWYGWNGTPNQGLRLTDSEVAEGIIEREKKVELDFSSIIRKAGPDCFNKKPDYMGGGQGKPTAEVFAEHKIYMSPGDPSRKLKIRQFRERLRYDVDEKGNVTNPPMMQVFDTCVHFIRTIPDLVVPDNDIEEIDTTGEDHVFDEACHICMARPIAMKGPKIRISSYTKRIDRLLKEEPGTYEAHAIYEQEQTMRELGVGGLDFGDEDEYDDGQLISTIE